MKFTSKFTSLVLAAGLAILSALQASAASYVQVQFDTNRLALAVTNFYNVPSDVNTNVNTTFNASTNQVNSGPQYFDLGYSRDAYISIGGFYTNSTANPSNIVYTVLWSGDFANWTTNNTQNVQRFTLVVPGSSTNWCSSQFYVTNTPPAMTWRSTENINPLVIGALTNSVYMKVIQKPGI